LAIKFLVTLIENGSKVSQPIEIYDDIDNVNIDLFTDMSGARSSILPQTDYIVKIQGVDENDNTNNGVVVRIFTGVPVAPSAPSNINAYLNSDGLLFTWFNSQSSFSYNLLFIVDRNISTGAETNLLSNYNNDTAKSYLIVFSSLNPGHKYTFTIRAVDKFSNESSIVSYSYTISSLDYTSVAGSSPISNRPPAASRLFAFTGDREIRVIWAPVSGETIDITHYRVWRASKTVGDFSLEASDFSLVETVSSDINSYTDYDIEENTRYIYIVTTVDNFGNNSLNPSDDDYFRHSSTNAISVEGNSGLCPVTNVEVVNPANWDTTITWDILAGDFDGYEIYRSDLNKCSWSKVGANSVDILLPATFSDTDSLISGDGNYYYVVRGARNGARVVASTSSVVPPDSFLLATVVTGAGTVNNISRPTIALARLDDYIRNKLTSQINEHKHDLTLAYDRRIDLNTNVIIENWSTDDQITFYTYEQIIATSLDAFGSVVISLPSSYIVRVDGEITSVPYKVDPLPRKIVFESVIDSTNISVECIGINEIDGIIDTDRVKDFSATQIGSGKLPQAMLPDIEHDERYRERLIPLQLHMESNDGYTFKIYQNEHSSIYQNIGNSVTFYDLVEIDSGELVAATSSGLLISDDAGDTWSVLYNTYAPVHRFYHSSSLNKYLALSNGSVYVSDDGSGWARTNGLENTSIVRDATDDGTNLFVSTDIGAYILQPNSFGDFLNWQSLPLYSGKTTDSYAIWYDSTNSRLVVSTEIGLFESNDTGTTWTFTDELEDITPVWEIIEYNNYVFALTDYGIWRKRQTANNFYRIASFDADIARRIVLLNNRIIISTNEGALVSDASYNIYTGSDIGFSNSDLYLTNFCEITTIPTLLSVIGSELYIGTDQMLFSGETFTILELLYENSTGTIPTFYIGNEEQTLGVYYSSDNDLAYFDRKMLESSTISVANQYSIFKAENGGWIDEQYNPDINIYDRNGLLVTLVNGAIPIDPFNNITFDTFNDFESNAFVASSYESEYTARLVQLRNIIGGDDPPAGETTQTIISDLVALYQKTYSQFFGEIKYGSLQTIDSLSYLVVDDYMVLNEIADGVLSDYVVVEDIPEFEYDSALITSITANGSNGVFVFSDSSYNKYDILHVTITKSTVSNVGDYTHKEVEDILEMYNSGLPYSLSEVNDANLLKTGLFLDRTFNDLNSDIEHQSDYFIPRNRSWYNMIDSTVDWISKVECGNLGLTVDYVTDLLHVSDSNRVLVGTTRNLIYIDKTSLNIYDSLFNNGEEEYVNDLFMYGSYIYAITNDHLYISQDNGISWELETTFGLSGTFRQMGSVGDMFIFATDNGLYYKYYADEKWEQGSDTITDIIQFVEHSGVFALSNSVLYYSPNGIQWTQRGTFGDYCVSRMRFLSSLAFFATASGLRTDAGTVFRNQLNLSLVDLSDDISSSAELKINDVWVRNIGRAYIAVDGSGNYYIWESSTQNITTYSSGMDVIHKVIRVDGEYWIFGNGAFRKLSLPFPIELSTGIPF